MNYILNKLNNRISVHESMNQKHELLTYYRAKCEFALLFHLSYLWNKNIRNMSTEDVEYIYSRIISPALGTIVELSKKVDINKELFIDKKFLKVISDYPNLRNDTIGHGYFFEDKLEEYFQSYKSLSNELIEYSPILTKEINFILVTSSLENQYLGICFKPDGNINPWACPQEICKFETNNLYASFLPNEYYRLSPFIHISKYEEIYLYRDIEERLTGRIRYNKLITTGTLGIEWDDFCNIDINVYEYKKKSLNGTIINVFNNNYKQYIDVGIIKDRIIDFLTKNRASVGATVWGHGGVGKTASVQSVCDILLNKRKYFDYILFLSAKDRFYNVYSFKIEQINKDERVETFESVIRNINTIIFNDDSTITENIQNYQGRILLIIDDYETFPNDERTKIENFIKSLDINKHKVIITTRARIIIGDEIRTNELNQDDSANFLLKYVSSEFPQINNSFMEQQLDIIDNRSKLLEITGGRPLFIIQFAIIYAQLGDLSKALSHSIKTSHDAIEFLYGRIYDYLSINAKDIFVSMSLLINERDLSNLIDKIEFILNLENEEEKFKQALKELEELKIIEINDELFKVYSPEIVKIMIKMFEMRTDSFKSNVKGRFKQVSRDKTLDIENTLLNNANTSRITKSEQEVTDLYRHILYRPTCPNNLKLQAILNLTDYLFNNRGKKEIAIRTCRDFADNFISEPQFIKM